jgi:hypothetical protein
LTLAGGRRPAGAAKDIARGLAAGAIATLPMSAVMLAARRAGWLTRQAPERITTGVLARAGAAPDDRRVRDLAASVTHVGFGAAAGAVFALIVPRVPAVVPRPLAGAAYGTVVYAGSYHGWAPALGLMPPAWRDERGRQPVMIGAHWVYGAVLGGLLRGGRRRRR